MGTISSPQPNVPRSEDAAVLLGTGVHAGRSASGRTGGRSKFQRIAVFCGASDGASPCFAEAAVALGKEMAARRIQLVYGGGSVGLMGVVSRTVRSSGLACTGCAAPPAACAPPRKWQPMPVLEAIAWNHDV